jgi:hypothetical protein
MDAENPANSPASIDRPLPGGSPANAPKSNEWRARANADGWWILQPTSTEIVVVRDPLKNQLEMA